MKTTDGRKRAILEGFKNGLIVSCQVQRDDPIYTEDMAVKMAEAAKWAGAAGIRANQSKSRFADDRPLQNLARGYRRIHYADA